MGTLAARNSGTQQSSRLASFVGTNALLVIPPRESPYLAGETITAMLIAPPLGPAR
jgi:molybdopterin molybdotransferase